jgi:hypothetical protein
MSITVECYQLLSVTCTAHVICAIFACSLLLSCAQYDYSRVLE